MTDHTALMNRAGALLFEAAGLLRMEADDWHGRKTSIPRSWDKGISEWSDKCERIASINVGAAAKMTETAKKIAKVFTNKAGRE